jgi:CheY-like chemotaxis protein
MASSISFMRTTLNSLVATYHILLMTINRCTDYTKTSHNITLVPTPETMSLSEAIDAPISCAKELQKRVDVELQLDEKISEYIIMDRQWLEDNLLCLVSNAVKYSEEGTTANVKVFLCDLFTSEAMNSFNTTTNSSRFKKQAHIRNVHHDNDARVALRFEVEDAGPGMHFFDNNRNFEDFSRTEIDEMKMLFQEPNFTVRKELGGSGLGLHCLAIRVDAIGGQYGIRPRYDHSHGCVFWFSVPYIPVSSLKGSVHTGMSNKSTSMKSPPRQQITDRYVSSVDNVFENDHQKSHDGYVPSDNGGQHYIPKSLAQTHAKDLQRSLYSIPSFYSDSPRAVHRGESSIATEGPITTTASSTKSAARLAGVSRFLVVDDSLPILKILKLMLEKNGFEVVTAANGTEAVKFFQRDFDVKATSEQSGLPAFDAILMDVQMPVMGGVEAITMIRSFERCSHPELNLFRHHLIVAMSAGNDDQTLAAVYNAGADEFLSKPFNLKSFKKILRDFPFKPRIKEDHAKQL